MPGLDEVLRTLARIDSHLDRAGAVAGRDPRRDTLPGLDRDREGGAERGLVAIRHRPELELRAPVGGQAQADEPAAMGGHEVDRLGGGELGRHGEVAFVLAVGRVDDNDHLPVPDVIESLLDGGEGRPGGEIAIHPGNRTLRKGVARPPGVPPRRRSGRAGGRQRPARARSGRRCDGRTRRRNGGRPRRRSSCRSPR